MEKIIPFVVRYNKEYNCVYCKEVRQMKIGFQKIATLGVFAFSTVSVSSVDAATIAWTDWTSSDSTSAAGTIGDIDVGFTGNIFPAAQTGGGVNYWNVNPSIFTAPGLDNPPPDSDIVRLTGGSTTGTQALVFSESVTNPVMAIMSLGRTSVLTSYNFDTPFTILNQGTGFWGGTGTSLSIGPDHQLFGREGHGLIQFQGTVDQISWTIPTSEQWHGFTVGVVESAESVPEPMGVLSFLGLSSVAGIALRKK